MTMDWRIVTRRRGVRSGWDVGLTPMLPTVAMDKAVEFNGRYPEYEHRAVSIRVVGGPPYRSPHLGKGGRS